jgi:hypothetical protein
MSSAVESESTKTTNDVPAVDQGLPLALGDWVSLSTQASELRYICQ